MAFPTTVQVVPLRGTLTRIVDGHGSIKSLRINFPARQLQWKPPLTELNRDLFRDGEVLHTYQDERR